MPNNYPLKPESWGEDDYIVGSKGHHDIHEFMVAVREEFDDWSLAEPCHEWLKAVPCSKTGGVTYARATPDTRGAFPATVAYEAYGDEQYQLPIN